MLEANSITFLEILEQFCYTFMPFWATKTSLYLFFLFLGWDYFTKKKEAETMILSGEWMIRETWQWWIFCAFASWRSFGVSFFYDLDILFFDLSAQHCNSVIFIFNSECFCWTRHHLSYSNEMSSIISFSTLRIVIYVYSVKVCFRFF